MTITEFVKSTDGAVTVDWVVMTAAVSGLGIAVMSVASGGIEDLSRDVSQALSTQMVSTGSIVTQAFTLTSLWNSPGDPSNDLRNVERMSFSTRVEFTEDSNGIIFESGGGGYGIILYQHEGVLYLQAGEGSDYGPASDRGEASWIVRPGTASIEGSLDSDGGLALYVDGDLVSQSSFDSRRLAGTNPGTIAGAARGVAVNRGGYTRDDPGHGGVTEVAFYEDQTTGDEMGPQAE